jgi:glyoxylase-like metal-dependent hydrolase (beta-lactamase superfamily II)
MAEQLADNLWRLDIPLVGNPLKNLNSYLLTGERNLLIDTGFNEAPCKEAMVQQMREIGADPARTDIFLTHLHYDHSGLSTFMHREGCRIYISSIDEAILLSLRDASYWTKRYAKSVRDGFSPEETQALWTQNPAQVLGPEPYASYDIIEDGAILHYGGTDLRCILTPGHTPGHMCLYNEERQWLFTGDHVLFRITPNICDWPGVKDSLGSYLESLDKIRDLPAQRLFPAHRVPIGTLAERVDVLKEHHRRRLAEAFRIVSTCPGLTPYEIAGRMQWKIRARDWKTFPLTQKFFAVGETVAHLDYLRVRHKVEVYEENNKNCYRAFGSGSKLE